MKFDIYYLLCCNFIGFCMFYYDAAPNALLPKENQWIHPLIIMFILSEKIFIYTVLVLCIKKMTAQDKLFCYVEQ